MDFWPVWREIPPASSIGEVMTIDQWESEWYLTLKTRSRMTTTITLSYQSESWFSPEHYLVLYRENLELLVVLVLESKGRLVKRSLQGFTVAFGRTGCRDSADGPAPIVPQVQTSTGGPGSCSPGRRFFKVDSVAKMRFPMFPGPALANWEGLLRHKNMLTKKRRIWFGNNIIIGLQLLVF